LSIIIDSTFRGTVDFLSSVVRIIAHVDAYYLHNHPHRTFLSIDSVSISVCRPVSLAIVREIADDESLEDGSSDDDDGNCDNNIDDDGDAMQNEVEESASRSEWSSVDTENTFSSFEVNDDVMAWFDDKYYLARVVEVDSSNELFTLVLYDDGMEVNNYKAQWMKHVDV
jgi:hypothetical protein